MKTKEGVCNASQLSVKRIILSIFFLLVLCRTAGAQDARKGILSAADAGTCTANSTACSFLTIPSGSGGVTFTITTNASGNTIQFEATGDTEPTGSHTWVALNVVPSNGTTAVTSTTSTGTWQANIAGFTQVRLRCSTFVGGTTTTYINLSTASARSNGGGGSVTHTAGNLTAFHLMLGNGLADSTVDSACVTNGTGALSGCTSIATTGSISTGSGASACGAGTTACIAGVEAATACTPTVGQICKRFDLTTNNSVTSANGAAEVPDPLFTAVPVGGKLLQTSGVAGGIAEIAGGAVSGLTPGVLSKSATATTLADSSCNELTANTLTCTHTAGLAIPAVATGINPPVCAVATSKWCGAESVPPTAVAAVDDLWPDSTAHSWKAHSNGAGIELVALISPGPIHQTAKTAAIATATLCLAADCGQAGNYTVEWAFTQVGTACGTPGTGGVTFLLTWTDQNAVTHSAIQMPMDDAASLIATTGTFHFTNSNATAWGSGNMNISSNGAILQYATGYTACGVGTGSYQLDAWVTRKQ